MLGKLKTVKRDSLPDDIEPTVENGTLTFGQLKKAIRINNANDISIGLDSPRGFDSHMPFEHMAVVDGDLFLFSISQMRFGIKDSIILNEKKLSRVKHNPTVKDLLNLRILNKTSVYLAIPKWKSINGTVGIAKICLAGPQTYSSIKQSNGNDESETMVSTGVLSIWASIDEGVLWLKQSSSTPALPGI